MSDEQLKNQDNHDDESHDFDGIKELDNKAPVWIIILFLATIGFSGIYAIRYFGHPNNEMDQVSEYEQKSEAFDAKKKAMQAESGSSDMNLEDMIAEGATLYSDQGCIACHGSNGEGNAIGPNLTDNFWLHGCTEEEIIHTITEGVPQKGMTPYKTMMSANQIKKLTAYIQNSLVGSNPENGKDAQGDECTE